MMHPLSTSAAAPGARFDIPYLQAALGRVIGRPAGEVACAALAGDASDRRYFRVTEAQPAAGQAASFVLMQLGDPVSGQETDFSRMQKFLCRLGLRVPRLYWDDTENGILFLEDVGDITLEEAVRGSREAARRYYRKAVELLVRLQEKGTPAVGPDCPAHPLRFDVEKLMWEFDFMVEHYVIGYCGRALSAAGRRELRDAFLPLTEALAALAPCLTHRDYHSRNLMVSGGELVMLDFQDARMGPCQYDLASLVRDSYVVLDDGLREELIDHYLNEKEAATGITMDREGFRRVLDEMSLQRNLKAVGTFAYQSLVKQNPRYQEYIAPTLAYVRQTLAARPGLSALGEVLKRHVPGLDGSDPGPGGAPC